MDLLNPLANIERVIAVVGCQRSGTTLTAQLLGADPTTLLVDEFDGVYPWFHGLMNGRADDETNRTLVASAATKYRFVHERFLVGQQPASLAHHVKTLVLKTPNLTFDEAAMRHAPWPITIIYPVRDPRAVVASMTRLASIDFLGNQLRLMEQRPAVKRQYSSDIERMADETEPLWTRQAVLWRVKSGRKDDFERAGLPVYSFRYEDLIGNSKSVVASMLDACGLDRLEQALTAHLSYVGHGPGGTDRTRSIDSTSLPLQNAFSDVQKADILRAAEPLASSLGYT